MSLVRKFVLLLPMVLLARVWAPGQIVKEKVEVLNVEVPVRVLLDGQLLDSLGKSDFKLYEDNELQEINGFALCRKKMNVQQITMQADPNSVSLPPRYFVLVFRIFQYNKQVQKGIDYLFANILRDQDHLLLLVNDRTFALNKDIWQVKRQDILDQVLQEEAVKATQELETYFQRVSHDIDQNRLRLILENRLVFNVPTIIEFLQSYLDVWREFKMKYLVPDLDKFYNFARYLEKIKAEKWVLNFYQIAMFPKMKITGPLRRQVEDNIAEGEGQGSASAQFARVISDLLTAIDRELGSSSEFPAEQIGKMLLQVGTTYHCFISRVEREGLSEDLEYKQVASDLENSLREITRRSGGEVIASGDIGSALHAIESKEDIYYVLTYEPKKPERRGKIMVKVNDSRCRLLYDDNMRSDYIVKYVQQKKLADPTIQLHDVSFSQQKLYFNISDFWMAEKNKKMAGQLQIVVRIRDSSNALIYDQSRLIHARGKSVSIAIGFDWLKPGRHIFLIETHDLLSGRTAMDVLPVEN
jgi:hypothetical protein